MLDYYLNKLGRMDHFIDKALTSIARGRMRRIPGLPSINEPRPEISQGVLPLFRDMDDLKRAVVMAEVLKRPGFPRMPMRY